MWCVCSVCTCVHMCVCVCMGVHVYVCVGVHACLGMHACVSVHACVWECLRDMQERIDQPEQGPTRTLAICHRGHRETARTSHASWLCGPAATTQSINTKCQDIHISPSSPPPPNLGVALLERVSKCCPPLIPTVFLAHRPTGAAQFMFFLFRQELFQHFWPPGVDGVLPPCHFELVWWQRQRGRQRKLAALRILKEGCLLSFWQLEEAGHEQVQPSIRSKPTPELRNTGGRSGSSDRTKGIQLVLHSFR